MSKATKYKYWLDKPVAVQFKVPYILCEDKGPLDVEVEWEDDKNQKQRAVSTFGSPLLVLRDMPGLANPAVGMSGMLLPDPGSEELLILRTQLVVGDTPQQVEVSFDPDLICFITMIPEHKLKSRIVT